MIKWLQDNKEWLFSGIGVLLLSLLIGNREKLRYSPIWYSIRNVFRSKRDSNDAIDRSKYISEEPADGTKCIVGKAFEKTWTIRNIGHVIWKNRYMKCDPLPNHLHVDNQKVRIPTIYPGQMFTLKVVFVVGCEGIYRSYWKMYDENNNLSFPQLEGLGVTIVAVQKSDI